MQGVSGMTVTSYENRLSIPITGDEITEFFSKNGELLAVGYIRIVIGARGPYVEFLDSQLVSESLHECDHSHLLLHRVTVSQGQCEGLCSGP